MFQGLLILLVIITFIFVLIKYTPSRPRWIRRSHNPYWNRPHNPYWNRPPPGRPSLFTIDL